MLGTLSHLISFNSKFSFSGKIMLGSYVFGQKWMVEIEYFAPSTGHDPYINVINIEG